MLANGSPLQVKLQPARCTLDSVITLVSASGSGRVESLTATDGSLKA